MQAELAHMCLHEKEPNSKDPCLAELAHDADHSIEGQLCIVGGCEAMPWVRNLGEIQGRGHRDADKSLLEDGLLEDLLQHVVWMCLGMLNFGISRNQWANLFRDSQDL